MYFAHLFVTLTLSKLLSLENAQINLVFCSLIRNFAAIINIINQKTDKAYEKCKTCIRSFCHDGGRDSYTVKEINEKVGRVWVQRNGSSSMDCKSIVEVTKVLD